MLQKIEEHLIAKTNLYNRSKNHFKRAGDARRHHSHAGNDMHERNTTGTDVQNVQTTRSGKPVNARAADIGAIEILGA